jgi:hypothetical protein
MGGYYRLPSRWPELPPIGRPMRIRSAPGSEPEQVLVCYGPGGSLMPLACTLEREDYPLGLVRQWEPGVRETDRRWTEHKKERPLVIPFRLVRNSYIQSGEWDADSKPL